MQIVDEYDPKYHGFATQEEWDAAWSSEPSGKEKGFYWGVSWILVPDCKRMAGLGLLYPVIRPCRYASALRHSGTVRPGELHPSLSQDPDLTLSRHPARATARRLPPSIEYRVPPVAG